MKEDKNEEKWDRLLRIRTTGRDDSHADQYRYPYEPTPYSVLERLAQSGRIRKKQVLLDYGCGKGRVDFFLAYQAGCRSIGIEYDDRIYFFNPFSVEILQKVMNRILDSYYEQMRPIQLFFYYPSDEYLSYLMTVDELMFEDEIECGDLFPGEDPRERIVIFELGG